MQHKMILALAFLIGFGIFSINLTVQAQFANLAGRLVFIRQAQDHREYITLTATSQQTYSQPQNTCTVISPEGTYVAQSSMSGAELVVLRLDTLQTVIQTPWNSLWESCAIIWLTDATLSIVRQGSPQENFDFDISNGSLTPFTYTPLASPQDPILPDWMSSTQSNFILPSPDNNIYLYERCNGQQTVGTGADQRCQIPTDMVIYNVAQQSSVHTLLNPNIGLMRGYEGNRELAYGSAVWSTTGHYLAFEQGFPSDSQFLLRIYDLSSGQYLNTDFYNVQIDSLKAMQWSPQGDILALWVVGRLDNPELNVGYPTEFRNLVFFNANTGEFVITNQPSEIEFGVERLGIWSPDGSAFAYVDTNGTLIYVNSSTGTTNVLDTNVLRIAAWTAIATLD